MCFSPEADLVGGLVIGGAGIDALRHVRRRREIALAALPIAFGAHQMIEAFTWWGLQGVVSPQVGRGAMYAYLAIAFALPLAVPWVIRVVEPDAARRRMLGPLIVLGGVVTAILLAELLSGPVAAEVCGRCIAYDAHVTFGGELAALYVLAACGPPLLSSIRPLRVFGILNLAAVGALVWLMSYAFISLWCAWAAVFSVVIVIHMRSRKSLPAEQKEVV